MADDPNPTLRKELDAADVVLDPEIRGLADLLNVSLSDDLRAQIQLLLEDRTRRRRLIQTVLTALDAVRVALDALFADGYPALDNIELPAALFDELQTELSDLTAATGVFTPVRASRVSVELGTAADKPTRSAARSKGE